MASIQGIKFGCNSSESYDTENFRVNTEHTATYIILMDTESQRENSVALVPGVPYIGMPSPILPGALCASRSMTEIGPKTWEVEASFNNTFNGRQQKPDEQKPQDKSPEWSWSFETVEEALLWDAQDDSQPITSSAGEPLVPPPTTPIVIPILNLTRFETTFTPDTILTYTNQLNTTTFWGAAAGKVLCAGITAQPHIFEDEELWKVTYVFKFKLDDHGWKLRLLDQGTYYWTGTVGSSTQKNFGDNALEPVLGNLDGSGGKGTASTPSFVTYNRYDKQNFTSLQLDQSDVI